jgi:hypothetical protein
MKRTDLDKINDFEELKLFSEKLVEKCLSLQSELQKTKDKLFHLEEITKSSTSVISIASNEEELCKLEINRLFQAAKAAPLEFTQVKAFEIYVKSLMLIKGKAEVEEKKAGKKNNLSEDQLLQLALQVVDESNEQ